MVIIIKKKQFIQLLFYIGTFLNAKVNILYNVNNPALFNVINKISGTSIIFKLTDVLRIKNVIIENLISLKKNITYVKLKGFFNFYQSFHFTNGI